jgi:hypothetical protein
MLNNNMKNTLVIAYNGGAYGTYLEWVVNALTAEDQIVAPFTAKGTSHRSKFGHQLGNGINGWRKYVANALHHRTVRLHPKIFKHEQLADNLNEIANQCNRLILIYPDRQHELLCINNYLSKTYSGPDMFSGPLKDIDLNEIYKQFPVAPGTPPTEIPRWILREYLSYYLIPAWRAQVEWFFPDRWQHKNCMIVYVNDLLYHFESTVTDVLNFWQQPAVHSIKEFAHSHRQMLSLQQHLNDDQLCQKIVESTVNNIAFEWQPQSLANESWIQWQLRCLGFEIQCHELNCFPTNSLSLRQLIYRVQNDS